ncbi:MAG: hypothetical protein OQL19_13340, partial [Gammaproteobacteria bacterium]|nr:hypothetical protein [Gammaproteobacteria bacterium]
MNKSLSIACLLGLSLFIVAPITQAEINGIPTGAQLQEAAEKKTTFIETKDLKKMLDEELDMVLIDIRTAT